MSKFVTHNKHSSAKHKKKSAAVASGDNPEETDDSLANISLEELQRLKKDGYEAFTKPTNKSNTDQFAHFTL